MKNYFKTHGDITVIFLNHKKGDVRTIVSTSDLQKLKNFPGTWHAQWKESTKSFYAKANISNGYSQTVIFLHRFLLNPSDGMVIDHINHDTLDNTRSNLKIKTNSENLQNRKGATVASKSGIRGVSWNKSNKNWVAQVMVNKVNVYRETFHDIKLAEQAVIEARLKYHTI